MYLSTYKYFYVQQAMCHVDITIGWVSYKSELRKYNCIGENALTLL